MHTKRVNMASRVAYSEPATTRTNRPAVSTNYNLGEMDLGVLLTQAGLVCYGPAYTINQLGMEYGVTNASDGTVTFQAANGEYVLQKLQPVTSLSIPSGESRQLTRLSSDTTKWIIV